ncbi:acyl-CoA dehydrogenase family protein [Nocardia sp. alder85J]|uniref:acyl-CoA dehydrogenase family protein n=1 Tax=Nocardia sp. alder85J TaxID=2862949 RepID=UPI001CD4D9BF|nr:acyl-CoA dehydrogenase family protein [Nocardia sp. alder85J]MCX4093736.1 acyl-CoA dehydrogenase family protein [Nocardia sp. alder85J]
MDLELTADEKKFRDELRDVFHNDVPADIRRRCLDGRTTRDDLVTSMRILNGHGLAVPEWPVKFGGQDWSEVQRFLYASELQRASVPQPLAFNASMVGPVLCEFGSPAQQQRFLSATANLDIWWSQGFSEPEAGSDLASLKTTARRDGDEWVIDGSKTWTTLGQYGDWMFLLARTDPQAPKRQMGISFFLLDMDTPGLQRRPIVLIDGEPEVNEFFFDGVRIPAENLVGQENQGWTYAKFLLGNERNTIARIGTSQSYFEAVAAMADRVDIGGAPLSQDPEFRARLYDIKLRLLALEATQMRVTGASADGKPSLVSSLLKLEGTKVLQELSSLRMEVAGSDAGLVGQHDGPDLSTTDFANLAALQYLNLRKVSIFGGTNEIQRRVIALNILGLKGTR